MSDIYWIGDVGDQSWSNTANWSGGAVPATGDNVYLLSGSSDINSGLAQSAVQLASLNVGSSFTGTVGVAGDSGASLQIGATVLRCFAAPSGSGFLDGGFSRFKIDFGTSTYTGIIQSMGDSQDAGRGALQIKGGSNTSSLYVTAGSVDVATVPGTTATLVLLEVSGGVVTTGSGLTCPTVNQTAGETTGPAVIAQTSGGGSTLIFGGACTTLTQTGGTLYTLGAGLIATIKVGGSAVLGNRPASGNAHTTLTIDAGGSVDFSADPRPLLIANPVVMYKGASLSAFNKTQVQLAGPASLQLSLVDCGLQDVTINVGNGLAVTVA